MSWLENPAYVFLIAGVAAILIELLVLQFSTFWLLFIGVGALIASLFLALFPEMGWLGGMGVFVMATVVVTVVTYKPLKRWLSANTAMQGNDACGQITEVIEEIAPGAAGKVTWSGAEWKAELDDDNGESIAVGSRAEIVQMHGITLTVKATTKD